MPAHHSDVVGSIDWTITEFLINILHSMRYNTCKSIDVLRSIIACESYMNRGQLDPG